MAVEAYVRHNHTEYDWNLRIFQGMSKSWHRSLVDGDVRRVMASWSEPVRRYPQLTGPRLSSPSEFPPLTSPAILAPAPIEMQHASTVGAPITIPVVTSDSDSTSLEAQNSGSTSTASMETSPSPRVEAQVDDLGTALQNWLLNEKQRQRELGPQAVTTQYTCRRAGWLSTTARICSANLDSALCLR